MPIYTYSDPTAACFTAMIIEAESITAADVIATAAGVDVRRRTVSIGIRLVAVDLSAAKPPAFLNKGNVVHTFHYWPQQHYVSNVFPDKQAALDALKNELKAWLYNPNVQLFWEYPTAHYHKQRIRYAK